VWPWVVWVSTLASALVLIKSCWVAKVRENSFTKPVNEIVYLEHEK